MKTKTTPKKLTPKQAVQNKSGPSAQLLATNMNYYTHMNKTAHLAEKEIKDGLKILNSVQCDIIGIFGSHSLDRKSKDYIACEKTAYALGTRGYGIITGGGPGIMEAGNSGATRAKAPSIGFKAKLLTREQTVSDNLFTHKYAFTFLFTRRFNLAIKSRALLFYPGGYGTFNELFEYITLMVTQMVDPVPIILVNKEYWKGLFEWIKKETRTRGLVGENYLSNIYFADTTEEIIKIIEKK